jgi:hypothetical protein
MRCGVGNRMPRCMGSVARGPDYCTCKPAAEQERDLLAELISLRRRVEALEAKL